jgi:hypothetical protein
MIISLVMPEAPEGLPRARRTDRRGPYQQARQRDRDEQQGKHVQP